MTRSGLGFLGALGLLAPIVWGAISAPDAAEIVERSAEANNRDWAAAPQYEYTEVDRTGQEARTFRVSMILGSPYRMLVAIDGMPLDAAAQAGEERTRQRAIAARTKETPAEHDARVAAYREGRRRDHLLTSQLVSAFDFKLLGEQRLGSRTVYVLQARPRPAYVPPVRDAKVLRGMQGELWIDTTTFQWVKVEASVVKPVWIAGFLARVDPGTRFMLDFAPVSADVWLPTRFVMNSHARVLFMFSHHDQADQSYSDYRKEATGQAVSNGSRSSTR